MTDQSNSMKISEQIESICRYDSMFDKCLKPTDRVMARRYIELLKLRHESYTQETRYIFEKLTGSVDTARIKHRLLDRTYRLILKHNYRFPLVLLKKIKSLLR